MAWRDRTGDRVGSIVVTGLREVRRRANGQVARVYDAVCDCGNAIVTLESNLYTHKGWRSCRDCYSRRLSADYRKPGRDSRLYRIWCGMKSRCLNKNQTSYKFYGARGVTICGEWLDFDVFMSWAMANGYRDDLSIDRLDSAGNYEPSNCEWIPFSENAKRAMDKRWHGKDGGNNG